MDEAWDCGQRSCGKCHNKEVTVNGRINNVKAAHHQLLKMHHSLAAVVVVIHRKITTCRVTSGLSKNRESTGSFPSGRKYAATSGWETVCMHDSPTVMSFRPKRDESIDTIAQNR